MISKGEGTQIGRKVPPKVKTLVYFRFIRRLFVRIIRKAFLVIREEGERNSFPRSLRFIKDRTHPEHERAKIYTMPEVAGESRKDIDYTWEKVARLTPCINKAYDCRKYIFHKRKICIYDANLAILASVKSIYYYCQ